MTTNPQNDDSQQPSLPSRPSLIKYIDEYRRKYYLIKARDSEGFSRILDLLHQEIDGSRLQYSQSIGTMSIELPIPVSENSTCAGKIDAERHNALVLMPNLLNGKDVFWAACHHEYSQELRADTFADGSSVCTIDKTGIVWLESFLTSVSQLKDHAALRWLILSGKTSAAIHRSCRLHLAQELLQRHPTKFWSRWSLDARGLEMSISAIDEARKLYELDPMNRRLHKQFPFVLPPEKREKASGSDGMNTTGSFGGRIVASKPWKPIPHLVPSFEDMASKFEEHRTSGKARAQTQSPIDAELSQATNLEDPTAPLRNKTSLSKISWGDIKEFVPRQHPDSSQAGAQVAPQESSQPEGKKGGPCRYRGKAPSIQSSMKNKGLGTSGAGRGRKLGKHEDPRPQIGNGSHSLN